MASSSGMDHFRREPTATLLPDLTRTKAGANPLQTRCKPGRGAGLDRDRTGFAPPLHRVDCDPEFSPLAPNRIAQTQRKQALLSPTQPPCSPESYWVPLTDACKVPCRRTWSITGREV